MTGLGAWLLAMVSPLVGRVLLALGFQVVSIVGLNLVLDQLKGMVMSSLGNIPAAGLQLAILGGAGEGLGIIFGAIATRMALWQIQNGASILGVRGGS